MEWSWRTVMILIGLLGMAAILVDGFRRMKQARSEALRLDVAPASGLPEDDFNPELPGKARVVERGETKSTPTQKTSREPVLEPSTKAPTQKPEPAIRSTDTFSEPFVADRDEASSNSARLNDPDTETLSAEDDVDIPQSPLIPTPRPVNLDEKVPVLLDVEELGDDNTFAEGIISRPRVISTPEASSPKKNIEAEDTDQACDSTTPVDVDLPLVEDPENINDPHLENEVEDLPENAISHLVNFAGTNAEVLADRPDPEVVLVIHTIARDLLGFSGKDVLFLFNSCDLRYGEKDIFHRFEEADGEGCIQFSVAQMRNPGVFEPAQMADENYSGLSFFMSLPGPKRPLEAYEAMSEMAMAVSRNLNADVLDGSHSAMTPQTMEHERQQILDYERQQRLAAKKQRR